MKHLNIWRTTSALLLLSLVIAACATVPITGRRQLTIIPAGEMQTMSFQQYDDVLAESKLSRDAEATALVQGVGVRIQAAVERYFHEQGMPDRLSGYDWEFNLIESDQVNAWCMPGGKVAFYTGILPVCGGEAGIAVVMGHEIAHAIAEHGNERMSQGLILQMGGAALSEVIKSKPEQTRALYMNAFAVGSQFGAVLPYSRKHESEADHMGLIFMSMAGFDPHEAPKLWERMAAAGGAGVPEFMSTHPSDQTRVRQLNEHMVEALEYYRP